MKSTFLLGLLASTSLASGRIHSGTHALAIAASLISGPLAALAVPVWTPTSTQIDSVDASVPRDGLASSSSAADTGTTPQNTTSSCQGHHHHHHNGTAASGAQGQNETTSEGHRSHNGTTTHDDTHNSTSFAAGSGECNATEATGHHHHNGTTGTMTAASFFIPTTATASALAVALTSSAATDDVEVRSLGGFAAMVHRT
jgi:hypothetical protein